MRHVAEGEAYVSGTRILKNVILGARRIANRLVALLVDVDEAA